MKALVAYFSAGGTTAAVAEAIAKETGAELFEIKPEKPYSKANLNWMNPLARCNREHIRNEDIQIVNSVRGFNEYDYVFLGYPIWYFEAPNIIKTFVKAYDWRGKKVALFATSGGSNMEKSAERLLPLFRGNPELVDGELCQNTEDAAAWAKRIVK